MRRLLLALALALVALPAGAVTRMYFPGNPDSRLSFTQDASWEESNEIQRGRLSELHTSGSIATVQGQTVDITEDTANQEIDRQFVSAPLAVGTTFTSGSTTVTMQLQVREFNTTDDVTESLLGVRILSNDGSTVRATLMAVANYGPTAEFNNGFRNKTFANADAVGASYTTVSGDRLVVEVGYQTDGAETSPQASARWGLADTVTDCPADETTTTTCQGWIEFSNTFSFVEDSEVVGFTYLVSGTSVDGTSCTTASVSPAADYLHLLAVVNTHGTSAATPTVTGASMTWDQVATVADASGVYRITVFRAESSSPGSGALTIDFGGATQTGCRWNLTRWSGTDTNGSNGSSAIVQSPTNTAATGTSLTVTLSAVGSANNAVYGVFAHAANEASTPGTGFDAFSTGAHATPNTSFFTEWSYNDTSVDASWATSSINVGMAIEIKKHVTASAARRVIVIN